MTIGKRIRERRVACGLSVSDLAKQLGKNRSTVYRYESDEIENLPTDILEPIAAALHTSPAYLMGWTEDPVKEEKVMPSNLVRLDTVKYIPLVGEIACGTPILAHNRRSCIATTSSAISFGSAVIVSCIPPPPSCFSLLRIMQQTVKKK